jgi:cytochrome P450 family 135
VGQPLSDSDQTLETRFDAGEDDYLDAVITESLRLRPAIPITGCRALQDTEVNGVSMPKDATVMVPMLAVHERPEFYERPDELLPERFVGTPAGIDSLLTLAEEPTDASAEPSHYSRPGF